MIGSILPPFTNSKVMERKKFLTASLGLAGLGTILIDACKKTSVANSTTDAGTDGNCVVAPTETEGPFPYTADGTTKSEISNPLNRSDIRSNSSDNVLQTGIPLSLVLQVVNVNNNCSAVSGVRVDLWHCNKDGYYSGYGNQTGGLSGISNSYLGQNWLRGYQVTDASGQAKFTTIFPGWYQGRATHIHFEIFIDGVLKKQTQMTFPETISDAVQVTSLYASHGINTTRNASDQVFGNSSTDLANETFTITGDVANGYTASHNLGLAL
jgi:protocatechuate 3,4-dioxygenase beta subunit